MAYVGIGNRQDYVADFQSQNFSGDGSTTAFTLNYEAVTGSIRVAVDNVLQPADGSSYTVDGFTLNFDTAPASGTNNITILFLGTVRNISSVSDGAIINSKIQDNTIQAAKLAYDYNQYRNIIINGDMSIAQRGTSATGLGEGDSGIHTCDRWKMFESGVPTYEFTQTQDTDVPTGQGFATSLKMDCTTAQGSLTSSDLLRIIQIIEGQNLQYLKYGTANATSLTASFWVKSTVTGDYNTHLYASGATNRIISSTFTINSADTWEKKTITFAGDTAQVIPNDSTGRLLLTITLLSGTDYTSTDATSWGTYSGGKLAYGQVANIASSTANNFYITGVQLEAGTTASDFEFLPVDVNLNRCLRYYQFVANTSNIDLCVGAYYSANSILGSIQLKEVMRTTPSIDIETGTNYYASFLNNTVDLLNTFTLSSSSHNRSICLVNSTEASGIVGYACILRANSSNSFLAFDAEL